MPVATSRIGCGLPLRTDTGAPQCKTLHPSWARARDIRSGALKASHEIPENTMASRITQPYSLDFLSAKERFHAANPAQDTLADDSPNEGPPQSSKQHHRGRR